MSKIDEYLDQVVPAQKTELERIRKIVQQAVPEATEGISYGMPVFKYDGKYLIGFAAFKDHMSVFPGALPIEQLKKELDNYKLSKGTIQFTLDNPLPDALVRELLVISLAKIQDS
ncbi:MAG: DUF1801 domain-containing protein [Candidatus Saccharibacteria bacterium]